MYLYHDEPSFFHSLHPVTKTLFMLLMIAAPFFTSRLSATIGILILYLIFLLLAHASRNLLRIWKLLLLFWIFTFVIWIVIPRLRHEPWSYINAALLATRIDSFVLTGILFSTTTRIEEFTYALTKLAIPYKAAFAISLGFRLVPLFYQNLQTIVAAQKSRGVDLDSGSILKKAKQYIPIMGILISYGIRNADMMSMSLEAKGFGYSSHRTSYLQPRFGWRDILVLTFGILLPLLLYLKGS
jgi:energy-coupling factor transport system permease protein